MKTTHTPDTVSAGLALMLAGKAAFAPSAGDRLRIGALNDLLASAIDCKARFDTDDGQLIEQSGLAIRTCVGVFRPLDPVWYHRAAIAGGTYARMWEKRFAFKPFIVPEAWMGERWREVPVRRQRLVPGVAVVLPETEPGAGLQQHAGGALWWCTSLDTAKTTVTLCRYRLPDMRKPSMALNDEARKPVRRVTINRNGWDAFVATIVLADQARAA